MTEVLDEQDGVATYSAARTIVDLLRDRVHDQNEGLRFEGRVWTWEQVVQESARQAHLLRSLRREGPFHVGVMLDNVPEYVFLLGGAAMAGAVVVGINPTRRGAERATDIRHTDCQLIITDERRAELLDEDTGVPPDRVIDVGAGDWEQASARQPATMPRDDQPTPESLFLLVFTSGSTGAPKAVKHTHGRMAFVMPGFTADDVLYCPMPLFHGNALISNWVPAMASGATLVLKRRFSASTFLDDIRSNGVTFFNTVGRALSYILATPPTPHDRDHQLKFVLAPESSAADVVAFRKRFGVYVAEGYGSSEGAIRMAPDRDSPKGSLGKPIGTADVVVVDAETLLECPRADIDEHGTLRNADVAIGEMVRRDPGSTFAGYYNNDEAEAARTRNGWFWSGDLAYRDDAGYFFFAGRNADWIRVDGENFSTAPVERILERFAPASGVAVYGVPDPRTGDQVMAAIELRDGEGFDPAAFQAFLDDQPDLGTKWAPRFVLEVDRLPTTATNKTDKTGLRRQRWHEGRVWWRPDRDGTWRSMTDADRAALGAEFATHGRADLLTR